jgi:beta-mannosidase
MVWQDFALACAIYPQTDDFARRMASEAQSVVPKLRNHPSLVLWAGTNEIDETHQWANLGVDPNTDRLSREVLPEVVRRLDPARPYLPSSPYRGPELVRQGNHERLKPEDHLWGPRDDFKGPYYVQSPAHFVSETGYHGCPERKSLEQMLDSGSVWPWQGNEQWLTKSVRGHPKVKGCQWRVGLMANQIRVLFDDVPETLDDFVLASQISQAEALKFFIERMRIGKWRRTGILWWNLRDGWPVISDAVVDYYNRKKLAYEYIRRVQADVCGICGEAQDERHVLAVVNDTLVAVEGGVTVRDAESGAMLMRAPYHVEPNGSAEVGRVAAPWRSTMWLIEWTHKGGTFQNHYLAGPRPFSLTRYARWMGAMGLPADLAAVAHAASVASRCRQ